MLSDSFIDWWHAPWSDAIEAPAMYGEDHFGRSDAYMLWCEHAGMNAALPTTFDTGWSMLENLRHEELSGIARLFGGIIAARAHALDFSAQLSLIERKWCASIASTQPLNMAPGAAYTAADGLNLMGLTELAWRVERDFCGLWPRVALRIEKPVRSRIVQILGNIPAFPEETRSGTLRAQRCWQISRRQAAQQVS